jgi:hypothetical protein
MNGSVLHNFIVQVIVASGENPVYLELTEKHRVRRTAKECNSAGPFLLSELSNQGSIADSSFLARPFVHYLTAIQVDFVLT